MYKCKKCWMLKIDEKSKCACNAKPFNEKKLFKDKPIAQISEKKQKRIKENWSEMQLFKKVFIKYKKQWKNKCQVCQKILNEDDLNPSCFPHILPKWKYPEFRYFENNIWLVCGINCHSNFDKIINKMKNKIWSFDFEQIIRNWNYINIEKYIWK